MRVPRKKKKRMKKGEAILYRDTWYSMAHGKRWAIHGVEAWKKFFSPYYREDYLPTESNNFTTLNFSNYGK